MIKKAKNRKTSSQSITNTVLNNTSDYTFTNVLENLPIGVVIFTLNKILFLNKEAIKIFKLSKTLQKNIGNYTNF